MSHIEKRTNFIKSVYGSKLEKRLMSDTNEELNTVIDKLIGMDPTFHKKFSPWIAREYVKELFRLEDFPRIQNTLNGFISLQPRLKKNDIYQYSFYDLEDMIDLSANTGEVEAYKPGVYDDIPDTEYLYRGPLGILASPQTEEASVKLGSGTKWCTASREDNVFSDYHEDGKLYIWIDNKKKTKYQFWKSSERLDPQFKDARDRDLDTDELIRFVDEHPVISKLFSQWNLEYLGCEKIFTVPSDHKEDVFYEELNVPDSYNSLIQTFNVDKGIRVDKEQTDNWYHVCIDGKELLVAKTPILNKISLFHLREAGLAGNHAVPFTIDIKGERKQFRVRMLKRVYPNIQAKDIHSFMYYWENGLSDRDYSEANRIKKLINISSDRWEFFQEMFGTISMISSFDKLKEEINFYDIRTYGALDIDWRPVLELL